MLIGIVLLLVLIALTLPFPSISWQTDEIVKIETLVSINGIVLMVFYTKAYSWQFAFINKNGTVYRDNSIFDSASGAEREGREWVRASI